MIGFTFGAGGEVGVVFPLCKRGTKGDFLHNSLNNSICILRYLIVIESKNCQAKTL